MKKKIFVAEWVDGGIIQSRVYPTAAIWHNKQESEKYLNHWMQERANADNESITYNIIQLAKDDGEDIILETRTVYPNTHEIQQLKLLIEEKNKVIYNLQQTVNELEETLSNKVTELDEVKQLGQQLTFLHTSLKEKNSYIKSLTEENIRLVELLLLVSREPNLRRILWEEK